MWLEVCALSYQGEYREKMKIICIFVKSICQKSRMIFLNIRN